MIRILLFIFLLSSFAFGQSKYAVSASETSKRYSQAIGEYIKAAYKKDKSRFDTLFIGRHEDFPDITLPARIGHTAILLVSSAQADRKLKYRKSFTYLNIIGTVTPHKTDFLFVTFLVSKLHGAPGYMPQHNCRMDFTYNPSKKAFELQQLRFEYPYRRKK